MKERTDEIDDFLAQNGWQGTYQLGFSADFSPRRYRRLTKDSGDSAILMEADPDQKTDSFVSIAALLRKAEISAPEIFAASPSRGLVLMEDFGSHNLGQILDAGADAQPLYYRAVDVLVRLHQSFVSADSLKDLPVFNAALFTTQAELFLQAYIPHVQSRQATLAETESFRAAWKQVLALLESLPQTLLLRDFMPDNLMSLPHRAGWRSIGVLDFQDAGQGSIAYDLASLCEVVRRDGGGQRIDAMIAHYHEQANPPVSLQDLKTACTVLAAQRHTRILGIIASLVAKTGQGEKRTYLPRVQRHLDQLLQDKALTPVREWMVNFRLNR